MTEPQYLMYFPPEILTRVLTFLDSPSDVIAFGRTCKIANSIVVHHENWITRRLLPRLINPAVMSAALLVMEARKLPPIYNDPTGAPCWQFIQTYVKNRGSMSVPKTWSLHNLDQLLPLYQAVEGLRDLYVSNCMKPDHLEYFDGWNTLALPSPASPLTEREKTRIELALYTYELFCVLFGHDPTDHFAGRATQQMEFRKCFSHWELEQVASVFDVIRVDAYRSFRLVARHDVTYGFHMIEYDKRHSPVMRHIVETGVEFIYDLITQDGFYGKRDVLKRQHAYDSIPRSCSFWPICYELADGSIIHGHDFAPFSHRKAIPGTPRYTDPDSGPAEAWRWISRAGTPSSPPAPLDLPLSPFKRWILRHKGYVFWDSWRVQSSLMMEQPFRQPFYQEGHYHTAEQLALEGVPNNDAYNSRMVASWHARKLIFMDGGRGFWDFSNKVHVEWGHPRVPVLGVTRGMRP